MSAVACIPSLAGVFNILTSFADSGILSSPPLMSSTYSAARIPSKISVISASHSACSVFVSCSFVWIPLIYSLISVSSATADGRGFGHGLGCRFGRTLSYRVLESRGIRISQLVWRPVSRRVSAGMSVWSGGSNAIKSVGLIGWLCCSRRCRLPSRFALCASSAVEYFLGCPPAFFWGILFSCWMGWEA
jgi:hypothetical protein